MMNRRHDILRRDVAAAVVVAVCMVSTTVVAEEPTAEQLTFFEQQVRPLLAKRCYECHSTEAQTSEGGLFLDSRDGWETGGDSGAAIEAGNVEGSLLISAVRYNDLDMPPDGKLPAKEIAILERWVEMGAPDPRADPRGVAGGLEKGIDWEAARKYWAFQPPRRHDVPEVVQTDWPRDDVDRFILAKIEAAGLAPTVDADRRTWLRRVRFDLTGLPPTPEELDAFLADGSAEAKARIVDRLLASTAFGEHWGRHWLDVARYADTNGGDFNATYKSIWRYRDYVIAAFNDDKPFDEFVREQLAGDLLPSQNNAERAEKLIATGFLMIGCKMLSERDKPKFRMDVVDEQVDTVGRAFLGLTLGCARCHDHKFDPLPTADYYALAGIFQSTETYRGESQKYVSTWKEVELPVEPDIRAAVEQHQQRTEELQASIKGFEKRQQTISGELQTLDPDLEGIVVDDSQAKLAGEWKKSTHTPRYFGEGYIHNDKQDLGEKSVTYVPMLPTTGRYEVRMSFAGAGGRATNVPVVVKHADGEERLTVDQSKLPPIDKLWLPLGTFSFTAGTNGSVTILTDETDGHVLADAMQFIPVKDTTDDVTASASSEAADSPTDSPADAEPDTSPVAKLREQITELTQQIEQTRKQLKKHQAAAPPPIPTCMAVREHPEIGDAAVRIRGEVHREGDIIPRGFLTILSGDTSVSLSDTSQSGRRELAEWTAADDNPLTSRVMVNRVWHHLFGRGIVASVDNFGKLGEQPTHPELLDTLAVGFVEDGWSVKRLIRRLTLSRTYGLSSTSKSPRATPRGDGGGDTAGTHGAQPVGFGGEKEIEGGDPNNDLLSHARRHRLPAESLRDAMLAISGQLDRTAGGSAVGPLKYLAIATSGKKSADLKVGENHRRSVYLPMVRNDLPEFLRLFDIADPELVTGRRSVTNVPAQALYLMNSPFVSLAAEQTTVNVFAHSTDDARRLNQAYALLLSRQPTVAERKRATAFLTAEGTVPTQESWTQLVHILLASTEFRMLD